MFGEEHMNTQAEALRLADEFENGEWIAHTGQWREEAAAELRRQHEELNATERQVEILSDELSKCNKANQKLTGEVAALSANALDDYKAIQELLDALEKITHYAECQVVAFASGTPYLDMTLFPRLCVEARAAIAKHSKE
jgi:chromosome segregation ATPase